MEAIHDSICDSTYKHSKRNVQRMLEDVWAAIRDDKIDLAQAVVNVAYEQFMDAAIGKGQRTVADAHTRASRALGIDAAGPVSIQTRTSWSQRGLGGENMLQRAQKEIAKAKGKQPRKATDCDSSVTRAAIAHYISNHPAMRTL